MTSYSTLLVILVVTHLFAAAGVALRSTFCFLAAALMSVPIAYYALHSPLLAIKVDGVAMSACLAVATYLTRKNRGNRVVLFCLAFTPIILYVGTFFILWLAQPDSVTPVPPVRRD